MKLKNNLIMNTRELAAFVYNYSIKNFIINNAIRKINSRPEFFIDSDDMLSILKILNVVNYNFVGDFRWGNVCLS